MKLNIFALTLALSFMPLMAWSEQTTGAYLYEQLEKPVYKKTFNALFQGQANLAPWLIAYLNDRNGVDSPSEMRTVADQQYEFYQLCEPHNCGGNVLYVFFEIGGARAWALFTKDDGSSRFFGSPDATMQAALTAEVH